MIIIIFNQLKNLKKEQIKKFMFIILVNAIFVTSIISVAEYKSTFLKTEFLSLIHKKKAKA